MKNEFLFINLYQCTPSFETAERVFDYHYKQYLTGAVITPNK